jgi:Ca-activated chloride channel family protein
MSKKQTDVNIRRKDSAMKRFQFKQMLIITGLIVATTAAMAFTRHSRPGQPGVPGSMDTGVGPVSITGKLVQDKLLVGSDGRLGLAVTLQAAVLPEGSAQNERGVDLVVVLDKSGSMAGQKIQDARQALIQLISSMAPGDRMALVGYSDQVYRYAALNPVSESHRTALINAVERIHTDGGTNLGAGLAQGIQILEAAAESKNIARVILISDGLANQGVTDPMALGQMAAAAAEQRVTVGSVGVGYDFNEQLMTHIADRGAGDYYFLETPQELARTFQREYRHMRATAATGLTLEVPLTKGVTLLDAAGYPFQVSDGTARVQVGNLASGQSRTFYLTLQVPTDRARRLQLGNINLRYRTDGEAHWAALNETFEVACVTDPGKVSASIEKETWGRKVLDDDTQRLKEAVAGDIKAGRPAAAMARIQAFEAEQKAVNDVVGSEEVAERLDEEMHQLRGVVNDTFSGEPAAVAEKRKVNAKNLQYEGYRGRKQN